jgi:hypothetical protein
MVRLQRNPVLRERSVAFGQELLGMLGWKPAAATVMNTLTDHPCPQPAVSRHSLAVVTAALPGSSGSCGRLCAGLESKAWQTDFFAPASGPRIAGSHSLLPGNRLLPVEVLRKAIDIGGYPTVLFVLSNSVASVPVLKALMQSRLACRSRRIAYLHDEDFTALFEDFLGSETTMEPAAAGGNAWPWTWGTNLLSSGAGWSLRFLVETGALDGVVVGSTARRDALRATLGSAADRLSIEVAVPEAVGRTLCEMPGLRGAVPIPLHVGA